MSTPSTPYQTFRVQTSDNRRGVVDVYDGIVVEASTTLVECLGMPWWEVRPRLAKAEPEQPCS